MTVATIEGFGGQIVAPSDEAYDRHREVWNAVVDRRPALIARCTSVSDVAAAVRHARDAGLEIGVKCGGHSVTGLSVPDGGLMIDLTPMSEVRVDPAARRATVGGGALLRSLDRATEPFGLATTAGNVSHTGVGGLTLGGGMGWLARQLGMACDNVERYTVVTADGEVVEAAADDHPDLFWALRGGGGNFGIVTEFVFRLHPIVHRVTSADLVFDADHAREALDAWRDLLADAPRAASLTADAVTASSGGALPAALAGQPVVAVGFTWVGDPDDARAYLDRFREGIGGRPVAEFVDEMTYVERQTGADEVNRHGTRRYASGHYLAELPDAAIDAFLSRGVTNGADDWTHAAKSGFLAYGGAIADVPDDASAFSQRDTLVEWVVGCAWSDPEEDEAWVASGRASAAVMAPFASGVYVNVLGDDGDDGVRRAYRSNLDRLREIKRRYDPDNVFHLNQNIRP